jgi:hypothetical protein
MADISLTQAEANALIAMEKHRTNDDGWDYPVAGQSISVPLISIDKRENFILDVYRGRIDLLKGTYQHRSRQVIILIRLDFGGQPHRNPDDGHVPSPHLHVYREGYGDRWAIPIPEDVFPNIGDPWATLDHFMLFCNITRPPLIQRGLFA